MELFLALSSSIDVDFHSDESPRVSPETLAALYRVFVLLCLRDSVEENRSWSSSTRAFLIRSVSLADPQGPRSRRTSGVLSVSENEDLLFKESFL